MGSSVPRIPGIKCDEKQARNLRKQVSLLLNRRVFSFPGSQPVSFAKRHLEELQKKDYYLCEKTDGIRCLLYCTEDENGREIHYLIDRKNDYYFFQNLHFPHPQDPKMIDFHRATLIDGELVNDRLPNGKTQLRYLVFDCLVIDGKPLLQKPLDKRIGAFSAYVFLPYDSLLKAKPESLKKMPFEVKFKKMEKPYGIKMMFYDKLPNLEHGNDGLVFTCKESRYVTGTDENILKWKPAEENSIDFRLKLGQFPLVRVSSDDEFDLSEYGDVVHENGQKCVADYDAMPTFDLYVSQGKGEYSPFAPLQLTEQEWEAMKSLNQQLDGRIIECYRNEDHQWCFKKEPDGTPRFRDDKPEANYMITVKSVLQSIEDSVTQEDLLEASDAIFHAWKKRHPEEDRAKRLAAESKSGGQPAPPAADAGINSSSSSSSTSTSTNEKDGERKSSDRATELPAEFNTPTTTESDSASDRTAPHKPSRPDGIPR